MTQNSRTTDAANAERERLEQLHRFERDVWASGARYIGGIDEVGRGPLAGPVTAACVVIEVPLMLEFLNDSKCVTAKRRLVLDRVIREQAAAFAIAEASVEEIDRLNIARAVELAMQRAIAACKIRPEHLLVDAVKLRDCMIPQHAIVDGDALSAAIAAASIIAKVHRDAKLVELDRLDPRFGFAKHKGYGTAAHIAALHLHGPSEHHRRSFAPVGNVWASGAHVDTTRAPV